MHHRVELVHIHARALANQIHSSVTEWNRSWSLCVWWSALWWQNQNLGIGSAGQGRAFDLRAARDVPFKIFYCLDGYRFFITIVPVDGSPGKKWVSILCCFRGVHTKTLQIVSCMSVKTEWNWSTKMFAFDLHHMRENVWISMVLHQSCSVSWLTHYQKAFGLLLERPSSMVFLRYFHSTLENACLQTDWMDL